MKFSSNSAKDLGDVLTQQGHFADTAHELKRHGPLIIGVVKALANP